MVIKYKSKFILSLLSLFSLSSCFPQEYKKVQIPDNIKQLEEKELSVLDTSSLKFRFDEVNSKKNYAHLIKNDDNQNANIALIPQIYSDSNISFDHHYNQVIRGAFAKDESDNYISVEDYIYQTSSGSTTVKFDLYINQNGLYELEQNFNNTNISLSQFINNISSESNFQELLIPCLSYLAVLSYENAVGLDKLNMYDSDKDSFLDSIFIAPAINNFQKSLLDIPQSYLKLLNSKTFNLTNDEAVKQKEEVETILKKFNYINDSFNFTLGSYSFSSFFYLTETNDYYRYNNFPANNHQFIYETFKLLGLTDFIATDSKSPIGNFTMLSQYAGDLDPYSKILLNLQKTYIVKDSTKISFDATKDFNKIFIVSNKDITSIYDEYFLISYYDYDQNKLIKNDTQSYSSPILLQSRGFLIYHIKSNLEYLDEIGIYKKVDLNSDVYNSNYSYSTIKKTNSLKDPLVSLIENDFNDSIFDNQKLTTNDMFRYTSGFNIDASNLYTLNDGSKFNYQIYFEELSSTNFNIYLNKVKY